MAEEIEEDFDVRFREDEELEFFTELALHETERWIQAVTKKNFAHPDDTRKSLENGVLLCELANSLVPGAIRRINRLSTPIAGLDNINVFLKACRTHLGLSDGHLFNASDLEDLSQRAIGESDRLKEEYDKRLRNVAVTVYWLGRYASTHYQGPQLDQSAFSALVHSSGHQGDSIVDHQGFHSPGTPSSNCWDWTRNNNNNNRNSGGSQHTRDGSFDSFSKDSVSSLEAMPHPTLSNGSSSNFREGHSMDRSSGSLSHRRYSSTDSMDGSVNSGHSRQDSDSNDSRRSSTQMLRRQSTGDPLQFIKGKPSTELAQLAETQIKVAAESKKEAITTAILLDEEDPVDWQANLSTWKSRRKSQSERSYMMKEELEKMEREKDGGDKTAGAMPAKTYSQMAEERERRKSTGRHFYPIHDEEEDDDDIFSSIKPTDDKKSSNDVFAVSDKPRAEIAPWARGEVEEEKKDNKYNKDEDEKEEDADDDEEETSETEDEEINNNKENNENGFNKDRNYSSPSRTFPASTYSSKEPDNDFIQKESIQESFAAPQQQQAARPVGNNTSSKDILSRNESFKSVGPRTQSKIGSIMNKFQESQTSAQAPKQGYNERIDLKARMKSFQGVSDKDTSLSSENQNGSQRNVNIRSNNFNNYRNSFDQKEESQPSQLSPVSHSIRERSKSASSDSKKNALKQVEKIIKIRQKPNDDKGFGFIFTGGTDQDKPLTVSKVALGSGADVCELKMKDEIVSINQCDVTDKTSMEVGDMVAKAVGKGFIELRVHRERTSDDFSDDDEMTSSSDEGEEDCDQQEEEAIIPISKQHQYSQPEPQPKEPEPVAEITEEIQAIHVDRVQSAPQVFTAQPASFQMKTDQDEEEEDVDEEDGGPPAILRRWQRQRQRNEYAFENSPSLDTSDSPVYKKISLNAPIPKVDNEMNDDPKWRPAKPWNHMQDEWTQQQDQQRMPDERDAARHDATDDQANFDARQQEIKRQYEESLKIAERRVEQKTKEEQEFLQPEMEKARILEERRMARRNRIQEAAASSSTQPPISSSSSSSYEPPMFAASTTTSYQQAAPPPAPSYHDKEPEPPSSSNVSHVTSMSFNIESKDNNNSNNKLFNVTPGSFNIPRQPGNGVIVIDPRNRSSPGQQGTPLEFQVKLAPKANDDINMRMAQEEKERQRLQQLEEEKMKHIQDKERQLQEQEELLRQERERFRREQEEFRQNQQKLQQQQQQQAVQQQQSYLPPPPQQPQVQEYSQRTQHIPNYSAPYPSSTSPNPNHNVMIQPSLQPPPPSSSPYANNSSSISPVQFTVSVTSNSPSHSSSPYYTNTNSSQGPLPSSSSKPTWPPQSSQRSPQQQPRGNGNNFNSPRSFKPVNNNPTFASVPPQFNTSITATTNSNYAPASAIPHNNDYGRRDRTDGPKGKFSREDMLAMNKKPFQESVASRVSQVENQARAPNPAQNRMPIAREPPIRSQNQANPLNSAPKAKLRDDSEWKDQPRHQAQETRAHANRENSGAPRRQGYGPPQEHWLVQEAERRARAPPSQSGPIKPLPDISNKWRNNNNANNMMSYPDSSNNNPESMPHAIRQTLLQKTAGARGSDDGYQDGDLIPPPQQQYSLQQQQIPNRSVSPRSGGGGNNNYYHQAHLDQPTRKPQSSYSPNDLSNQYNINPIHQIQQPPPPTLNRGPPPPQGYNPGPSYSPSGPRRENGLPVNGSQLCSHCSQELGFGAAMVIESLGIFFHLQCFRCCVCHASLGTGAQGADVRVRTNKLHCQNCYSNDEAGLKFSKV